MIIRLEESNDFLEVENLTREAFWNIYRPGCFEHLVIHNLRNNKDFINNYVLIIDSKIIASITYALGKIVLDTGKITNCLIFGPVSVLPEFQHKGYGERIINYTLNIYQKTYPFVLITGNFNYYKKFGFVSASKYNIYYEGMDKNDEAPFFMIKVFDENLVKNYKGIYSDPEVYNIDKTELEIFDTKFPLKKKEIRDGQLK